MAIFWVIALPPGAKIDWLDDYASARELAQAESRPLLVDFGASWCGACGELDRHTFSDPRVVAAARDHQFVPVRVDLSPGEDTDEKRAVLASYEQRGLPLVVLHDREGNEVERVTAFVEAAEFLQLMDRVD
jgi:thiol:disulfide interchange protein DsbD